MDKYGVEQTKTDIKEAEEKPVICPNCGMGLTPSKNTSILLCPVCGSKPWEEGGIIGD